MQKLLLDSYDLEETVDVLKVDFPQVKTVWHILKLAQSKKIQLTINVMNRTLITSVDTQNHKHITKQNGCLSHIEGFKNQYILSCGLFDLVDFTLGKNKSNGSIFVDLMVISYEGENYNIHHNFHQDSKVNESTRILIKSNHLEQFRISNGFQLSEKPNKNKYKKKSEDQKRLEILETWILVNPSFNPQKHSFTKKQLWEKIDLTPMSQATIDKFFEYVKDKKPKFISFSGGRPKSS